MIIGGHYFEMSNDNKFEIGNKSEKLYFSVFDITTNRKHYPVKYKRLADQLQKYSLRIHSDLLSANAIKNDTEMHRQKRYDLQTEVITDCNVFLSLVKYSLHAQLISASTSEKWTNLSHDIKFMTLAWRKA